MVRRMTASGRLLLLTTGSNRPAVALHDSLQSANNGHSFCLQKFSTALISGDVSPSVYRRTHGCHGRNRRNRRNNGTPLAP